MRKKLFTLIMSVACAYSMPTIAEEKPVHGEGGYYYFTADRLETDLFRVTTTGSATISYENDAVMANFGMDKGTRASWILRDNSVEDKADPIKITKDYPVIAFKMNLNPEWFRHTSLGELFWFQLSCILYEEGFGGESANVKYSFDKKDLHKWSQWLNPTELADATGGKDWQKWGLIKLEESSGDPYNRIWYLNVSEAFTEGVETLDMTRFCTFIGTANNPANESGYEGEIPYYAMKWIRTFKSLDEFNAALASTRGDEDEDQENPTGVENSQASQIKIYASGNQIKIENTDGFKAEDCVTVYNTLGGKVLAQNGMNANLQTIDNLPKGIYLVALKTNGQNIVSKVILK